jgi:hypothetical protein
MRWIKHSPHPNLPLRGEGIEFPLLIKERVRVRLLLEFQNSLFDIRNSLLDFEPLVQAADPILTSPTRGRDVFPLLPETVEKVKTE